MQSKRKAYGDDSPAASDDDSDFDDDEDPDNLEVPGIYFDIFICIFDNSLEKFLIFL